MPLSLPRTCSARLPSPPDCVRRWPAAAAGAPTATATSAAACKKSDHSSCSVRITKSSTAKSPASSADAAGCGAVAAPVPAGVPKAVAAATAANGCLPIASGDAAAKPAGIPAAAASCCRASRKANGSSGARRPLASAAAAAASGWLATACPAASPLKRDMRSWQTGAATAAGVAGVESSVARRLRGRLPGARGGGSSGTGLDSAGWPAVWGRPHQKVIILFFQRSSHITNNSRHRCVQPATRL